MGEDWDSEAADARFIRMLQRLGLYKLDDPPVSEGAPENY